MPEGDPVAEFVLTIDARDFVYDPAKPISLRPEMPRMQLESFHAYWTGKGSCSVGAVVRIVEFLMDNRQMKSILVKLERLHMAYIQSGRAMFEATRFGESGFADIASQLQQQIVSQYQRLMREGFAAFHDSKMELVGKAKSYSQRHARTMKAAKELGRFHKHELLGEAQQEYDSIRAYWDAQAQDLSPDLA